MGKQWSYFICLAWLTYLMTAGLILFTRGFLLTRTARLEVGECVTTLAPCGQNCTGGIDYNGLFHDQETAAKTCLGKQARVVLLIVDALQYEFAVWQDDLTPANASYCRNKFPVFRDTLKNHPDSTRFYKFIADPPTTTMQRIKGLTTGSLPTFIDAGSNFASEEINEDNIIDQALSKGIVFMGDDTWNGLYPNRFIRNFPYPSFNVWDLDTVDNGVRKQIFRELKENDWLLLIGHALGVDHCGHRYGANHPEMARKLGEMNDLIGRLIAELQDDMMLIVIGDHGMTGNGDHGGDSKLEVEAAMFVHSKVPLLGNKFGQATEVHQIDLVPTLASILGIPVPFSNLGTTILEVLPRNFHKNTNLSDFQYALHSLWSNVVQTKNYIETYSAESSLFPLDKLQNIRTKYEAIFHRVKRINNFESFRSFVTDAKAYLEMIRDMCIEIWVQFDSDLMSAGLVLTFSTISLGLIAVEGIPRDRMSEIFESCFLYRSILVNMATAFVITALFLCEVIEDFKNTILFATGMVSVLMFTILVVQNWGVISTNCRKSHRTGILVNYSSRIIILLSIAGLFTNSYILEEALVLCFLLITLIWLLIFNIRNSKVEHLGKKTKLPLKAHWSTLWIVLISLGLVATLLIRFSNYFWSCREEQHRSCDFFELRKPGAIFFESSGRVVVILTLVIIALFVTIVRIWLHSCGNFAGFSPSVTVARYFPGIIVVCMGGYWVLQHLPKDAKIKFIRPWQVDMLTWVVYFCIFVGILLICLRPLYVYLLPKRKETLNIYGRENIIPQLFNEMKGLIYQRKKENETESTPVVYGLGTAYSATFVMLSLFLTLLCALLLGDTLAPSIIFMYVVSVCLLGISAMERYQRATNINELFDVPTPFLICWFLVSEYFFYATGHQPTFPKIHWDAAFVGTGGIFHTNVIPAVLIGINTFGSHIILGAMLPVLVMAPFTLYFMFPSLAVNKFQLEKDLRRGELLLYERESSLLCAVFTVSAKYILFHGIRTFGCMLSATVHCRHLMVWNVFSPKLIFESISFLITTGSVILSFLLLIRLHHQIDNLFTRISKST